MSSTRTLRSRTSVKTTLTTNENETSKKKSPRKRKETKVSENLQNANLELENSDTPTTVKQSKLEVSKNNRKNSVSPRKKKSAQETTETKEASADINDIENGGWEPNNWKEAWENILKMRKLHVAPVDSLGCEECPEKGVSPEIFRYQTLISVMLSSQTRDEVTYAATQRLIDHGLTVENILNTSDEKIGELIYPAGFWKSKVKYIKQTSQILKEQYNCDIPRTFKELCKLPGVGPKMANIVMSVGWNDTVGIAVDTHVHRISNRLGWVKKATKTPEETRKALENWLPNMLSEKIQSVLPMLTPEELQLVTNSLTEIGVNNEKDLKYVREEDLATILKPIQCRILIQAWKQIEYQTPEEMSPTSLPETNSSANHNLSSDWVEKYKIPWHKMSNELTNTLKENKRPNPNCMREFITIVSKSVHAICPKPGKANLKVIAKQAINAYPASFSDILCGEIVAEGYDSLTRRLVVKFDNMNRRDVFNFMKRKINSVSTDDMDEPPKRKITASDRYGCLNWQLGTLPEGETIKSQNKKKKTLLEMFSISGTEAIHEVGAQEFLKLTYYSQRMDINNLVGINSLLSAWPLLFTEIGMIDHFQILVGINIKDKLKESMSSKGQKIISYFKVTDNQKPKMRELFLKFSNTNSRNSYILVIFLLMEYFSEKQDILFKTVECSVTSREVEGIHDLPVSPCLIICGDDIDSATFMLSINRKIVNEDIVSFNDGFVLLFAAFYCFNLHYSTGAECSLEFIQRCFLGINPEKGSKANTKKKTIWNNRVLSFLEKLMHFEWC